MAKTTRVGKSLIEIQQELGTEKQCLAFIEALRWPDGVRCVKCQGDRISKYSVPESTRTVVNSVTRETTTKPIPAREVYQCLVPECKHQFTAMAGTIFNDSHLPLQKWMLATAIMCNAKKGVSAKQLQRDLATSYKTAWFLSHRIREAMMLGNWTDEKMTGTVEADETYVGGKYDKRLKRAKYDKPGVFGVKERETGKVYARHLPNVNQWGIGQHIDGVIDQEAKGRSRHHRHHHRPLICRQPDPFSFRLIRLGLSYMLTANSGARRPLQAFRCQAAFTESHLRSEALKLGRSGCRYPWALPTP